MTEIIGTAWKNGRGFPRGNAGYGIKIDRLEDRQTYFSRGTVTLLLEGFSSPVVVNTDKKSFWTSTCGELISVEIGKWLHAHGLVPWADGAPPKFSFRPISRDRFEVSIGA